MLQFPGCEEACQFHVEIGGSQREPVVQTRGEEVLEVSGGLATWPRPYRAAGPFVYVVMRRVGDRPWRQISQGMTPSARVPDGGILRVLVVNRDGLVAIYSPAPRQSGFGQARAILESLGRGDLLAGYPVPPPPPQGKRINTQIALPTTSIPNNSILVSIFPYFLFLFILDEGCFCILYTISQNPLPSFLLPHQSPCPSPFAAIPQMSSSFFMLSLIQAIFISKFS